MRDPVLGKNKYLRQALSLAYDTDLYNEIFLNGRAINAQGPLPPGIFGYEAQLQNPYKTYNLSRARELMVKAGYPGGIDAKTGKQLELVYDIGSDSTRAREVASFDMRCFEELGIKMKLQVNTWSQHLERSQKGTFQIFSLGWVADYPDPENFLQLLYGPNAPPNPNSSAFAHPEYDRLYEQMKNMENSPARQAIISKMVGIVIEECPWIFNIHSPSYVLRHSWFKNGKSHSISGNYRKYLSVDPEKRRAYRDAANKPNFKILLYILILLTVLSAPAMIIKYARRRKP
jgi:ABC-type transport system substrate-binding protein